MICPQKLPPQISGNDRYWRIQYIPPQQIAGWPLGVVARRER